MKEKPDGQNTFEGKSERRFKMINAVSFTIKGDYNQLRLVRGEGQSYVEMQLSYSNGCQYARFKFEDFKKAVEILALQDKNKTDE